jgi:hypothetical protein
LAPVVRPCVRIERRIPESPHGTSGELVRSGTGGVLDRSIAASQFDVHGSQDQADFADQVRVDCGDRINPVRTPVIVHIDAVANDHHIVRADTGKCRVLAAEGVCRARRICRDDILDACHDRDEIQNVVSDNRQILNLVPVQFLTDTGTLSCDNRVGSDADFHLRGSASHTHFEVVARGCALAQLCVGDRLGLETRERRGNRIFAGSQTP